MKHLKKYIPFAAAAVLAIASSISIPAAAENTGFSDVAADAWYADGAVRWANANGIVRPVSDGIFAPKENATRAQVADALMRYAGITPDASPGEPPADGARVLVAYFSRYGNTDYADDVDAVASASVVVEDGQRQGTTELVARMIAGQTGGDLHLIETADAYPVDFDDVVSQNHQEAAANARPALSSQIDVSGYDTVFVGYPVWASAAPAPVLSFLEELELSGKTVIPFCTHDGYGAGRSYAAVSQASRGAETAEGLAIDSANISSAERTVASWLDGLGFASSTRQAQGETAIRITAGGQEWEGVLYDSDMARQFLAQLPQTIRMSNYGGREVYGGTSQPIAVEGEGQLRFEDGDITYCPANQTAAIFYAQTDRPNLTMQVYPIGRVTSSISLFSGLPDRVEVTFEAIP